jgi:hypothetical protein
MRVREVVRIEKRKNGGEGEGKKGVIGKNSER